MMEGSRVHELPQYLKVRNVHFSSKAAKYTVSLIKQGSHALSL